MQPFDPKLAVIAQDARVKTPHVFHCWHAMRKLSQSFRRDVFANFAGLEVRHVDAIIAALEVHNALPRLIEDRSPKARGTRLPEDWTAPEDYIQWAIEQRHWTREDALKEAVAFGDWWPAQPGANAVKLDWKRTWQTWVRNSRRPDGNNFPNAKGPVDRAQFLRDRIALYGRLGRETEIPALEKELAALESNVVPIRSAG